MPVFFGDCHQAIVTGPFYLSGSVKNAEVLKTLRKNTEKKHCVNAMLQKQGDQAQVGYVGDDGRC